MSLDRDKVHLCLWASQRVSRRPKTKISLCTDRTNVQGYNHVRGEILLNCGDRAPASRVCRVSCAARPAPSLTGTRSPGASLCAVVVRARARPSLFTAAHTRGARTPAAQRCEARIPYPLPYRKSVSCGALCVCVLLLRVLPRHRAAIAERWSLASPG